MPELVNKNADAIECAWRYPTTPWVSSSGVTPVGAPPRTFTLLEGIDARIQGSLRRYLGNLLLVDPHLDPDGEDTPIWPRTTEYSWLADLAGYRLIEEVIPFEISKGQTSYHLRGFVIRHHKLDVSLRSWQDIGSSNEWYVEAANAYNADGFLLQFVSLLVYDEELDRWYWQSIRKVQTDPVTGTSTSGTVKKVLKASSSIFTRSMVGYPVEFTVTGNRRIITRWASSTEVDLDENLAVEDEGTGVAFTVDAPVTVAGVVDAGTSGTTLVADSAIFEPYMVGWAVLHESGRFGTIESWTSDTQVTLTGPINAGDDDVGDTFVVAPINGYTRAGDSSASENKPYLASGVAADYLTTGDYPLHVVSEGRFVYLMSEDPEFVPRVLWFDPTQDEFYHPNWDGWHWEKMGPQIVTLKPAESELYTSAGTLNGTGGHANGGNTTTHFRMVDYYRNRVTGISRPEQIIWTDDSWLDLTITLLTFDAKSEYELKKYPYFELFRSLPVDQGYGGQLYSEDLLTARTQQLEGTYHWDHVYPIATISYMKTDVANYDRVDITTISGYHTAGAYDDELAIGDLFDYQQDMVMNPTTPIHAAAMSQGLLFTAGPTGAPPDQQGSAIGLMAKRPFASIRWSSLARYAPECFPVANQYDTKVSVTGPMTFASAGGYLFLLGNGPIVRIQRVGALLDIVELPDSIQLASSRSVVEIGGRLVLLCTDGVYMLEPASGSIMRLDALDRLAQDYWMDLSEVSMTYDTSMGALYVHNPLTKQTVLVWMDKQTITLLSDSPFVGVVQCNVEGRRRAVFVTGSGRFVYPKRYPNEVSPSYNRGTATGFLKDSSTILALPQTSETNVPLGWVFRIDAITRDQTVSGKAACSLRISGATTWGEADVAATGTRWWISRDDGWTGSHAATVNDYSWFGTPVRFLTGDHRDRPGVILRVDYAKAGETDTTHALWLVLPNAADDDDIAVGDFIAISPVHTAVLGSPLESATSVNDPLPKREVHDISAPFLGCAGVGYDRHIALGAGATFPLAHVGVIDNAGIVACIPASEVGPSAAGSSWFRRTRFASGSLPLDKGDLPDGGVIFDSDDPSLLLTYIGDSGHTLFPFFVCDVPDCQFDLQQIVVSGSLPDTLITK